MKTEKIKLSKIDNFQNHPFRVDIDESFNELVESIKENGLINPLIVRRKDDGRYELISGHRRKKALELLEKKEVEVNIKELSDDEAVIFMVDSNMHREKILPSEKAYAYKMKLDALNHQGKSLSPKGTKNHSVDEIDESKSQIYRYVRLTHLIPELLQLVDDTVLKDKRTSLTMGLKPAVELSYLNTEEQNIIYSAIVYEEITPSHGQSIRIRQLSKDNKIDFDSVEGILLEEKGNQKDQISFNKEKIEKALPSELLKRDKRYIEQYIIKAIEQYKQKELERGDAYDLDM